MKRKNIIFRFSLFSLILCLGTAAAMLVGETTGLAMADLSNTSVQALTHAANGDTLYAVLADEQQGIYRSDDNGHSWQKISSGPAANISAIAVHPANRQIIYAGTTGGNVTGDTSLWYSNDKGRSWNRYGFTLPANPQGELPAVNVLTVDPNHPGVLYVGTEGQGLYRVQAAGYNRIGNMALYNLYVKDIVAVPDSPVYAVTTEGLLAIEGDAWRKIEPLPDGVVSLAVDPSNPDILYMGTVGYGAHRSTDGGESWQAINNGLGLEPGVILRVSVVTVDADNPRHVALATAFSVGSRLSPDGIYQSFDAGQSWARVADTREIVNRLTIKEGGIYAATAKGLVRYGEPLKTTPPISPVRLRTLVDSPTGIQTSILALTFVLGALVLVGRVEWLLRRKWVV